MHHVELMSDALTGLTLHRYLVHKSCPSTRRCRAFQSPAHFFVGLELLFLRCQWIKEKFMSLACKKRESERGGTET